MFQVDVLSGYLICGAGALVAAPMLRMADAPDARTRAGLRQCSDGFAVVGLGLLPAGLGGAVAHPLVQFLMSYGTLAGLLLVARGLGLVQGRRLPVAWVVALLGACALASGWLLWHDLRGLGTFFAVAMAALATLCGWLIRGFVQSPRDATERALGLCFVALGVSTWLRAALALAAGGPARPDMMYAPAPVAAVFALLYGVLPMIICTLLLNLVNARLRQQLRTRAVTDELTGSLTRRALREGAPALIAQERLRGREVAVLMLDLDRFKLINDQHGHPMGDTVLVHAAAALHLHMRPDALLARYGGEEFVAVVPVDDLPSARRVAERLRRAVEGVDWVRALRLNLPVTVSVGVALMGPAEDLDTALRRADEALYRAKREGRNQCQVSLAVA